MRIEGWKPLPLRYRERNAARHPLPRKNGARRLRVWACRRCPTRLAVERRQVSSSIAPLASLPSTAIILRRKRRHPLRAMRMTPGNTRNPTKERPCDTGAIRVLSCLSFRQSVLFQVCFDIGQGLPERVLLVGKQYQIVHVADIAFDPQVLFNEMIEPRQVKIGKVLAGQIADGDALARLRPGNGMIDEGIQQPEQIGVFDPAAKLGLQNAVVHRIEEFMDVQLQIVWMPVHENTAPAGRRRGAPCPCGRHSCRKWTSARRSAPSPRKERDGPPGRGSRPRRSCAPWDHGS